MRAPPLILAALVLAASSIASIAPINRASAEDAPRFFRIGTAATTGTYFQIGAEIANAISKPPGSRDCDRGGSCGVPGLVAVAQATEGSVENVLAVGQGQIEAAFAQADVTTWAYRGDPPVITPSRACRGAPPPPQNGVALLAKNGPIRNLRVIAALYPEAVHIVARIGSGIRALPDLKGKLVALGEASSGTLAEARLVLHAAALQECQLKAHYLRLSDASTLIENNKLDAFFLMAGAPVSAIVDAASMERVRLVPVSGKPRDALMRAYPFITATIIPGATYPGIDTETPTVAVPALFIVNAAVPDDLVYGITKALWQDATRRLLDNGHPAGKAIRFQNALQGVAIPLHPGAARYYTERGLTLPAEAMAPR
ncbi:MAG TPA: TAXI family TRAP transporter solute-binding subunit [Stellaceae bacterium]|jgi:TRAP transporter TAXI family solute receptor|nr:TAXI family TRAP transporter solute-binding subunit [Stellaceae bacterium]